MLRNGQFLLKWPIFVVLPPKRFSTSTTRVIFRKRFCEAKTKNLVSTFSHFPVFTSSCVYHLFHLPTSISTYLPLLTFTYLYLTLPSKVYLPLSIISSYIFLYLPISTCTYLNLPLPRYTNVFCG